MRKKLKTTVLILGMAAVMSCSTESTQNTYYTQPSSQINQKGYEKILNTLPYDPLEITAVASKQTIHHNSLAYFEVPQDTSRNVFTPWPPTFEKLLGKIEAVEPYQLSLERSKEDRIIGGCVSESYFLAGLLRYRNIPVRVRAGYFKNTNGNTQHFIDFWEEVAKYRGFNSQLLIDDPVAWKKNQNAYNQRQLDADHSIEHWICEYWNEEKGKWILLDANKDFLKLSSGIDIGYELPNEYFEYAHEAWIGMRSDSDYNVAKHEEYPQDGRSHIRSQLINDFYNLLNHDMPGYSGLDSASRSFVKRKTYEEVTDIELQDLDALAGLLSQNPSVPELLDFYNNTPTLRIASAEKDQYTFN